MSVVVGSSVTAGVFVVVGSSVTVGIFVVVGSSVTAGIFVTLGAFVVLGFSVGSETPHLYISPTGFILPSHMKHFNVSVSSSNSISLPKLNTPLLVILSTV